LVERPISGWQVRYCNIGLKNKLPENHLVIDDKGYNGDASVSAPTRIDNINVKMFKRHARACHEDLNGRLKKFSVLSVFEAVCVITQYSLENGYP
jgi:hypothetical protein